MNCYSKNSIDNCLILEFLFVSLTIIAVFYSSNNIIPVFSQELPSIDDPSLRLDLVVDGLQSPTSMGFLKDNSILITHKEGTVSKIDLNNPTSLQPILELSNVNSKNERTFRHSN